MGRQGSERKSRNQWAGERVQQVIVKPAKQRLRPQQSPHQNHNTHT